MNDIKLKIKELVAFSNKSHKNWDELEVKIKKQEQLFNDLTRLAREKKTLLGRIIKFGVADGDAAYVIDKVNQKTVHLTWIDYVDGYCDRQFGEKGGNLSIREAQATTKFEDMLDGMKRK